MFNIIIASFHWTEESLLLQSTFDESVQLIVIRIFAKKWTPALQFAPFVDAVFAKASFTLRTLLSILQYFIAYAACEVAVLMRLAIYHFFIFFDGFLIVHFQECIWIN